MLFLRFLVLSLYFSLFFPLIQTPTFCVTASGEMCQDQGGIILQIFLAFIFQGIKLQAQFAEEVNGRRIFQYRPS